MTVSTLEYFKEQARQEKTGDYNFLKRYLYFFELVVPAQGSLPGNKLNFLFPLILPPEFISLSEPYAVEATETQGGGLYVEENGIVRRDLMIKGNTGFRPRVLQTTASAGKSNPFKSAARASLGALMDMGTVQGMPYNKPLENKSYSRELPAQVLAAISGQRHFEYLQDAVFRTYADLKRDPNTSMDTSLRFHNPRDEEHWEVIPRKFTLERDVPKRFLYSYTIDLLVVGPAEAAEFNYSEDKTLLDQFRDKVGMVKKGVDLVTGGVNDLIRLQGEIRSTISNITTLIDSVTRIGDALQEFVDGNTRLVESTHNALTTAINDLESSLALGHKTSQAGASPELPLTVENQMRSIVKGLELAGADPSIFVESVADTLISVKEEQNKSRTVSTEAISEALASVGPSTYSALEKLGTALTPGEAQAINSESTVGSDAATYSSVFKVSIGKGDSLVSLAARYMGDAREWQSIAIVNGLKPPFVDDMASKDIHKLCDEYPFEFALGIGDYILIPTNDTNISNYPLLPVIGTPLGSPIENYLLGVDFALDPIFNRLDETVVTFSNKVLYDIPIDYEKGAKDVKIVEGLNNIKQSIVMRVVTEKGDVPLFKNFGLNRIIGLGFTPSDLENAKYRIRETIISDPRLANLTRLVMQQQDDALIVDMDIGLRGFNESKNIQVSVD